MKLLSTFFVVLAFLSFSLAAQTIIEVNTELIDGQVFFVKNGGQGTLSFPEESLKLSSNESEIYKIIFTEPQKDILLGLVSKFGFADKELPDNNRLKIYGTKNGGKIIRPQILSDNIITHKKYIKINEQENGETAFLFEKKVNEIYIKLSKIHKAEEVQLEFKAKTLDFLNESVFDEVSVCNFENIHFSIDISSSIKKQELKSIRSTIIKLLYQLLEMKKTPTISITAYNSKEYSVISNTTLTGPASVFSIRKNINNIIKEEQERPENGWTNIPFEKDLEAPSDNTLKIIFAKELSNGDKLIYNGIFSSFSVNNNNNSNTILVNIGELPESITTIDQDSIIPQFQEWLEECEKITPVYKTEEENTPEVKIENNYAKISPNPFSTNVKIENLLIDRIYLLTVYTEDGKEIYKEKINGSSFTLSNLKDFPQGSYLLSIYDMQTAEIQSHKIIKVK